MKTAKEIEAFVEAYGQCMGYESKANVETIALMLSMDYDEEKISDRFCESRTVIDAYILWNHAKGFGNTYCPAIFKKPVETTIEMYRESQYVDWENARINGGIYFTIVHSKDAQTISDAMAAIVTAVKMADDNEVVCMRVNGGVTNV